MCKKEMSKHCLDLICRFDIAVRGFKSKSFKLSTVKGIKKSKYRQIAAKSGFSNTHMGVSFFIVGNRFG